MTTEKRLGIWMDHTIACLMEYTPDDISRTEIFSGMLSVEIDVNNPGSEKIMHHREQDKLSVYFRKLESVIQNYQSVLLFGPADARVQLFNILKGDQHFNKIKIEAIPASKMSEREQNAFVKQFFTRTVDSYFEYGKNA